MRSRWIAGLLVLAGAVGAEPTGKDAADAVAIVRAAETRRIELAQSLAPAVCAVFRGGGGGSGVIISEDGLVLSNFHVTELESEMRIGLNDNRIHPAIVLGVDPSGDLSLLRLKEKRTWTCAPLGDSDALRQGDWVYAMGNPFLLATDFTPTITLGVVSGINRYQPGSIRGQLLYPDCIQTDASINPGNSGGPLFNFKGEVVGINGRVSLRDRGRVNIGVGYAISSNQIKLCLPELRAGKIVEHGTLNATVRDIEDPDWPGGIRVTFDQLLDPGCAHSAGIGLGDALLEFQGVKIRETNQFSRLISMLPKGRRVNLKIAQYADPKTGWQERDVSIALDGIPLIRESDKAQRPIPRTYIEREIDRTFEAVAKAFPPIQSEVRKGTLTVTGRDPQPLEEIHEAGAVTVKVGDRERESDDEKVEGERRKDMVERVALFNDLLPPDARRRFKKVDFTGGALVNGVTVDRIEVQTEDGQERVYFIHLDTGRVLRADVYAHHWVRWISIFYDDWRRAGDLYRPYKATIWDRAKERLLQTIVYDSIQKKS